MVSSVFEYYQIKRHGYSGLVGLAVSDISNFVDNEVFSKLSQSSRSTGPKIWVGHQLLPSWVLLYPAKMQAVVGTTSPQTSIRSK